MRKYSRCDHRFLVFVRNENRGVSSFMFSRDFLSNSKDDQDFSRGIGTIRRPWKRSSLSVALILFYTFRFSRIATEFRRVLLRIETAASKFDLAWREFSSGSNFFVKKFVIFTEKVQRYRQFFF